MGLQPGVKAINTSKTLCYSRRSSPRCHYPRDANGYLGFFPKFSTGVENTVEKPK